MLQKNTYMALKSVIFYGKISNVLVQNNKYSMNQENEHQRNQACQLLSASRENVKTCPLVHPQLKGLLTIFSKLHSKIGWFIRPLVEFAQNPLFPEMGNALSPNFFLHSLPNGELPRGRVVETVVEGRGQNINLLHHRCVNQNKVFCPPPK